MGSYRNIMPGFGDPPDGAAAAEFDYDMWLGPAPKRPYNRTARIYHFRWFWDYSGGQMTNLGAHEMDIVHWFMNVKGPTAVAVERRPLRLQETTARRPTRRTPCSNTPASPRPIPSAKSQRRTARRRAAWNSSAPKAA